MTTRGQLIQPTWTTMKWTVDLRQDLITRIQAFFSFEKHRASYPVHYGSYGKVYWQKMGTITLCQIVVEELCLKSVKINNAHKSQTTTKKTMLLMPFEKTMEEPDIELKESTSDDFTNVGSTSRFKTPVVDNDVSSSKELSSSKENDTGAETPSTLHSQELIQDVRIPIVSDEWYSQMEEMMEIQMAKIQEDLEKTFDESWNQ